MRSAPRSAPAGWAKCIERWTWPFAGLDARTPAVCRRPLSTPSEARLQQQLDSGAQHWLESKWFDHWLGRVLAFLANSFFLLEMTAAVDVYGGGTDAYHVTILSALRGAVPSATIDYIVSKPLVLQGREAGSIRVKLSGLTDFSLRSGDGQSLFGVLVSPFRRQPKRYRDRRRSSRE